MSALLSSPLGELIISIAAFVVGAAVVCLFSFGRVRVTSVSSLWGIQRLQNGQIGLDPEWTAVLGIIVTLSLLGVMYWLGWIH